MELITSNPPTITVQEVKDHLVIDYDIDDTLIDSYLKAAITYCVEYIGVYPYGREYSATVDELNSVDGYVLSIPKRPKTVTYIRTTDQEDLLKADIDLVYDQGKGLLLLPVIEEEATQIEATEGLNDETVDLFNQAVKLLVGDWYRFREDTQTLSTSTIPTGVKRVLDIIQIEV